MIIVFFVGGVDYHSGPYTAIFPAGSTNATFNVTIKDDDLLEANENIFFEVISITNNHFIAGVGLGTVTIIDTTLASKYCFSKWLCNVVCRCTYVQGIHSAVV